MWGICLDILVHGGKLFQRAIQYVYSPDKGTVYILNPVDGAKISVDKIEPVDHPPVFTYGEKVFPADHSDMEGRITDIVWHFKNEDYNYYISVDGRKKSKRYYAADLLKSQPEAEVKQDIYPVGNNY